MLIGRNFGICATINGKLAIKAPHWFYLRSLLEKLGINPEEI